MRNQGLSLAVLMAATLITAGPAASAAPETPVTNAAAAKWTATWSASMGGRVTKPSSKTSYTLRGVVRISEGGTGMRLRLSNFYARKAAVIGAVKVAPARNGAPGGPFTTAKFGGKTQTTIKAGKRKATDTLAVATQPGSDLLIDIWVKSSPPAVSYHRAGLATTRVAPGNHAGDTSSKPFTAKKKSRFFLTGIDVSGSQAPGVVIAFGDSITDGHGSTYGKNRRYPDQLAARLRDEMPTGRRPAVTNAGIGGNRLLDSQVDNGAGIGGVSRFTPHALDQQPGVRTVIFLQGGNDITGRTPPRTAKEMIAGYKRIVAQAHSRGIKVIGGTITPRGGAKGHTAAKEKIRREVNNRIRAGGVFDVVIDFSKVLRDSAHPDRLRAAYDSGDHRHPNDKGYAAMADAVEISKLGF